MYATSEVIPSFVLVLVGSAIELKEFGGSFAEWHRREGVPLDPYLWSVLVLERFVRNGGIQSADHTHSEVHRVSAGGMH